MNERTHFATVKPSEPPTAISAAICAYTGLQEEHTHSQ
jgi:hypothetical protein